MARETGASPPELTRLVKALESKRTGRGPQDRDFQLDIILGTEARIAAEESAQRVQPHEAGEGPFTRIPGLSRHPSLPLLVPRGTRSHRPPESPARTIQTTLKGARELGIVTARSRGAYEISDRFGLFADFARELDEYSNQRTANEFCPDALVIWQRGKEFIIRTKRDKEDDRFKMTAFSVFEDHGVPLFTNWHYYYHPPGEWRRTIDEVLLQSLLIRPRGSRENTAILMLWERNNLGRNPGRLRDKAKRYGLEDELETIVAYFEDPEKNRAPGFPRMSELKDKLGGKA